MKIFRNAVMLPCLVLVSSVVFGQKMKLIYDDDTETITKNGVPYAKMVKTKGDLFGLQKNFSVRNLEDDELIFVKYSQKDGYDQYGRKDGSTENWYTFSFIETGGVVSMERGMGLGEKGLMKILAQNDFIVDGSVDRKLLDAYILKNRGSYTKDQAPMEIPTSDTPVEILDNKIYQDGELIGKVVEASNEEQRVYHVYDKEGSKVMVAALPVENPIEWTLTRAEDGKSFSVVYEGESDGVNILTYLAIKGWLPK